MRRAFAGSCSGAGCCAFPYHWACCSSCSRASNSSVSRRADPNRCQGRQDLLGPGELAQWWEDVKWASPHFSPRGETKCVRGASVAGASCLATPTESKTCTRTVRRARRKPQSPQLGHGYLTIIIPLFSPGLSAKRKESQDRTAILTTGEPATTHPPVGTEKDKRLTAAAGKMARIPSNTLFAKTN